MWLKFSKGYAHRKSNVLKQARQAVMDALKKKYKSRRLFKRDRRTLWIMRVKANCMLHGLSYRRFICRLKEADINLNRKMLSQLGIYDRAVFTNVMDVAIPEWPQCKARRDYVRPPVSVEEADNVMIPHIEKLVPEIYTDATIRFNRKVQDDIITYTIDSGPPEVWREVLPKMPELANFNLPDHFVGNANAQLEPVPMDLIPSFLDVDPNYADFKKKVEREQAMDKEKEEAGEPTWPKKEGVSREDWFKEDPQSWY